MGEEWGLFGIGSRQCVGWKLAETEFICGLTRILQNFHVDLISDVEPNTTFMSAIGFEGGLTLKFSNV